MVLTLMSSCVPSLPSKLEYFETFLGLILTFIGVEARVSWVRHELALELRWLVKVKGCLHYWLHNLSSCNLGVKVPVAFEQRLDKE